MKDLLIMPLNELGDFLAGVFGPISLMWLVIGYFQQQKELRNNSEILKIQAEELRRSVEQHEELVKATREQIAIDLKSFEASQAMYSLENSPHFQITRANKESTQGARVTYCIEIVNSGKPATKVSFNSKPRMAHIEKSGTVSSFPSNHIHRIKIVFESKDDIIDDFVLEIYFCDALSNSRVKKFLFQHLDDRYVVCDSNS